MRFALFDGPKDRLIVNLDFAEWSNMQGAAYHAEIQVHWSTRIFDEKTNFEILIFRHDK
jgi:hypothetical protein